MKDNKGILGFSFLKSSTKSFLRAARQAEGYSLGDLLHGYLYARWPYLYIAIGVGEHPISKMWRRLQQFRQRWMRLLRLRQATPAVANPPPSPPQPASEIVITHTVADGYHGKVMPLASARRLVSVREDIRRPDLEQVIPYPRARALILEHPDQIAVLDCPCRSARPNPCLPLDVCLIVGEPFVSFILEHHPSKARRITQQEATRILEEEDARGHVHHAFFKDAMLGRFYAICNCCACCCGAMQAQRNGTPMLAPSGFVCRVDELLCIGCGECAEICQFHAIYVENGVSRVDFERCMGCGVCVNHCVQGALALEREASKGAPLEV
ncbi:MAG: 4Fe-4S binding protein [Anaerolineales bacterium]|nr:4Fe-4S binding protein [Anaerolineales bacterium]